MWEVRVGIQVSKRELHTHIHLNEAKVEFLSYIYKNKRNFNFLKILADELVVFVLFSFVPLVVPIPVMLLGLFTSSVQALVFATLIATYIGKSVEGHY